jgi:DNA (cytosine-5)-methyltransferase 1
VDEGKMSRRKRTPPSPGQLSLFDLLNEHPPSDIASESANTFEEDEASSPNLVSESANTFEEDEASSPNLVSESANTFEEDEAPSPNLVSESANTFEEDEAPSPNLVSESANDVEEYVSLSPIFPNRLFVPDRFDVLERRAKRELQSIIVPVDDALHRLDQTYSDMTAAGRGAFWVFRGESGSGKSTFLHTVYLFRPDVETISISVEQSISETLNNLKKSAPVLSKPRILVVEGREALTDFSEEQLEKDLHSINSFIRSASGERTLLVWQCNTDELQKMLISLAERIGGETLCGLGREHTYQFTGPLRDKYFEIATRTIQTLNEGASLVDMGVSEDCAKELITQANTIGVYLGLLRKELTKNKQLVESLLARDLCRVWTVVIAGNEPENEVGTLIRGSLSTADIDGLMSATRANVLTDLKRFPDKVGILAAVLDARIIYLPIVTALSIAREYANEELRAKMRDADMDTRKDPKARQRLLESDLAKAFKSLPRGPGRRGYKSGPNSKKAFEKLLDIAQKKDRVVNQAIGKALEACRLIPSFKTEVELRGGLNLRSDLLCETDSVPVRLEIMWRKEASRAQIAIYVLQKLQNYGRAIGFLE